MVGGLGCLSPKENPRPAVGDFPLRSAFPKPALRSSRAIHRATNSNLGCLPGRIANLLRATSRRSGLAKESRAYPRDVVAGVATKRGPALLLAARKCVRRARHYAPSHLLPRCPALKQSRKLFPARAAKSRTVIFTDSTRARQWLLPLAARGCCCHLS